MSDEAGPSSPPRAGASQASDAPSGESLRSPSLSRDRDSEGADEDEEDDPDYDEDVDDEDNDDDFFDAQEEDEDDDDNMDGAHIEFELFVDEDDEDGEDEQPLGGGAEPLIRLLRAARGGQWSSRQLLTFLRNPDVNELMDQLDEDDAERGYPWARFLRRRRIVAKDPNRFPDVPSQNGQKLMSTGVFGSNETDRHKRKRYARRLLDRELGLGDLDERQRNNGLLAQAMIPSSRAEHIIHYDDPIYSGQFSDDGNFFFSVCQDFKVRMYDTSSPYNWKHYKTVPHLLGTWTLTDASLSPDNKWLAYTSMSSLVSIAPTDPLDQGDPYTLDLGDAPIGLQGRRGRARSFGIFSVRFSGDGRELVAGTNSDALVVYDIESRRVLHHIEGHQNDVNAVCFADKGSPHIIYSGSDDATIKVWDRRSMGDKREAGAFVGHIEGLTYIDSKGDGRYILSNGKDQSMKLWDLRMIMSTNRFQELDPTQHSRYSDYDYRTGRYDENDWDVHPNDNSVVTFRGHKVLNTLIRCHFSPPSATDSRYVYSGSRDGKVYIWNMDATSAGVIDVQQATVGTRPVDSHSRFFHYDEWGHWSTCVRDASWHPNAPFLVASAWNGYNMARGTCTLHSFNAGSDDDHINVRKNLDESLKPTPWDLEGNEVDIDIDDI